MTFDKHDLFKTGLTITLAIGAVALTGCAGPHRHNCGHQHIQKHHHKLNLEQRFDLLDANNDDIIDANEWKKAHKKHKKPMKEKNLAPNAE